MGGRRGTQLTNLFLSSICLDISKHNLATYCLRNVFFMTASNEISKQSQAPDTSPKSTYYIISIIYLHLSKQWITQRRHLYHSCSNLDRSCVHNKLTGAAVFLSYLSPPTVWSMYNSMILHVNGPICCVKDEYIFNHWTRLCFTAYKAILVWISSSSFL